jgi:PhnB protein
MSMSNSAPIPHLVVNDGAAAIAFYEKAFGATLEGKHIAEDGKRLMHAHLGLGAGAVYLHDEFPEFGDHGGAKAPTQLGGVSCVIHLDVPDADAAWSRAVNAGAEIIMELENQFWGMRYGQIKDPFGHIWSIGGPAE